MKRIDSPKLMYENGTIIIPLGMNHTVAKIVLKLGDGADAASPCVQIKISYAKNSITSDLISMGTISGQANSDLEFLLDTPVSASDIYITLSDACVCARDVEIYEVQTQSDASCYPYYQDIDLEKNYYLDTVSVFTPEQGYTQYTIYTSMNGRDFEELARKTSTDSCDPEIGEVYPANGREARIIRVYMEYSSVSSNAVLKDVRFCGMESGTEIQKRPEIVVENFEHSKYDVAVTESDVYEEVYGIIERRVGAQYRTWFSLELAENPRAGHTYDYFELSNADGQIHVKANNGVSLASGIHHYLKYYCNVNVSQVGDQTNMPVLVVPLEQRVFRETKARVRYAYNYCTLSYTMAFWGAKEWRNELDWLALNGVNVVLDITAQEEVWRRFLTDLGYGYDAIKKFIAGPAYYAWAYMANHSGLGGPVHDSWFADRTELSRSNHYIMRKLGMQPVLQGYSGMVPTDILDYDPCADVIPQGTWCSTQRPAMLKTTSPVFKTYAEKFYKAQREVYGNVSGYYATDPFHEGGNSAGMSEREIAKEVLAAMLRADPNGIWILQSWQANPTSELLAGVEQVVDGKQHVLVLDLYAEKTPNYDKGCKGNPSHGYTSEFNQTPWVYCMLNNFGGRMGLHGHLDNLANAIPFVFQHCEQVAGIGITPESSENNPVLYDFLFESVWQQDAEKPMSEIDVDAWLSSYATRRYGKQSESARQAWTLLKETVYRAELNSLGQGAPESVVNARPALTIQAASTWGNAVISYDKQKLKQAAKLLLQDYDDLKQSRGYLYDLVTILQQVLSNDAQDCHQSMVQAYSCGNVEEFERHATEFMNIVDKMEQVTSTNDFYLLGRWVEQAKAMAAHTDDFTKRLYERNAKMLITTWGAYDQAETGGLHDYSNRQWSGLIGDFYQKRWERWIAARRCELNHEPYEKDIHWFEWEWRWVRDDQVYTTVPSELDLRTLEIV